MADMLRATRGIAGFHDAARVTLIEASPALRAAQRARLAAHPARWIADADALPEVPLLLVANEFFDALPIRQFTRTADGWAETVVGLAEGRLVPGRAAPVWLGALEHRRADTRAGDIVEICPAATAAVAAIAGRIARHGGAAIIVDYGGWRSLGDTFQAVRAHRSVDPLAEPGLADLTAHVDFEALARIAAEAGAATTSLTTQGALLTALGIMARAEALGRGLEGAALKNHRAATRRLTDASEMGTLFKALAILPAGAPPIAGFQP